MATMSLKKCLWLLFIYFSFMPWVSFRIIEMDTQPYFIIISIILLILNFNKKFDPRILYLLALSLSSLVIGLAYGHFDSGTFRSIATYSTPFFVTTAFYFCYRHNEKSFKFHLLLINLIWIFAAILQKVLNPYVLSFLVEVRTSDGRGVTSFAPEPTHFAIYLIFISWVLLKEYKYKALPAVIKGIIVINILSIVFLAKSSMGVLLALILITGYFVCTFKFTIKKVFLGGVLISLSIFSVVKVSELEENSRLTSMINLIQSAGVIKLLMTDESVNLRAKAIAHSIYGAFDNVFIPQGFHNYKDYSTQLSTETGSMFWTRSNSNKIMSGLGAPLFELGLFGLLLFFYVISITSRIENKRIALFETFFIPLVMFTAITVSFPLFVILLAQGLKKEYSY